MERIVEAIVVRVEYHEKLDYYTFINLDDYDLFKKMFAFIGLNMKSDLYSRFIDEIHKMLNDNSLPYIVHEEITEIN
jgi:flavodoxin